MNIREYGSRFKRIFLTFSRSVHLEFIDRFFYHFADLFVDRFIYRFTGLFTHTFVYRFIVLFVDTFIYRFTDLEDSVADLSPVFIFIFLFCGEFLSGVSRLQFTPLRIRAS